MKFKNKIFILFHFFVFFSYFSFSQGKTDTVLIKNDETGNRIPALDNFHKVIVPLWHDYYPKKDYDSMKIIIPEIEKYTEAIYKTELPEILKEKKEKWESAKDTFKIKET